MAQGYGHCLHNYFVDKYSNRAMLPLQHALPLGMVSVITAGQL